MNEIERAARTGLPRSVAVGAGWLAAGSRFLVRGVPVLAISFLLACGCGDVSAQDTPNDDGIYDVPVEPGSDPGMDEGGAGDDGIYGLDTPLEDLDPGDDDPDAVGGKDDDGSSIMGEGGDSRTQMQYGVATATPMRGFRFGDLDVTFLLASTLAVDDNIFLRDDGEPRADPTSGDDSDVLFINVPGVRLDLGLGDHQLMAEYRMEVETYADHDEVNQVNNFYDVQGRFNFAEVYFNVGDRLQTLSDPVDLALSNKAERLDHTTNVQVGMKHQRLTLEANYQHEYIDFEDDVYQHIDHQEDYVSVLMAYQLNARWEFTMDYRYGERDYEENVISDSNVNIVRGGLRGYLTPKLEIAGKVGYESVNLERGSLTGDLNDYSGVAAFVALKYRISPRTTVGARYSRTTKYGTYSAYEIFDDVELSASHQLTQDVRLGFNLWYSGEDPSKGPARDEWGVRTGADWAIKPWWHVSAEGLFRWQESDAMGSLFVVRPDGHVIGPAGDTTGSLDYSNAQFLLSSLIVF